MGKPKKRQPGLPKVRHTPTPRKTTMGKMLRAHKKRLYRSPTTPTGR